MTSQDWWQGAYRDDVRRVVDPYFAVSGAAPAYGFTFIDTEAAFNGPELGAAPAGMVQADGIHPTPAGQELIAQTFAAHDGLGQ
jgi:phospholipase/lecithinase/hemolysin